MSIDSVFSRFSSFGRESAGVNVSISSAVQHSTVFACIRDKAESVGQLPVLLYRRKNDGTKEQVHKGREHRLLTRKPNDFMTWQNFIEMYMSCRESRGNFYAYIERNDRGSIMSLIPLRHQANCRAEMDQNGNVYYNYVTNDNKPKMVFAGNELIHIKIFSLDGLNGMSPISYNADAIGMGIGQERHLSSLLKNGAMPKGLLETDLIFQDRSKAAQLREEFDERYAGTDNAGKSVLLENGVKFRPLTISPADSELLMSRQYTKKDICSIFRVPPRRVGADSSTDKSDIEQENKDYYVNHLMPAVVALENAINDELPDNLSIKIDERGFVRGDFASLVEAFGGAFTKTAISMNEFREGIGFQPKEGGEVHALETNNITLGRLEDLEKIQAEMRTSDTNNQPANQTEVDED